MYVFFSPKSIMFLTWSSSLRVACWFHPCQGKAGMQSCASLGVCMHTAQASFPVLLQRHLAEPSLSQLFCVHRDPPLIHSLIRANALITET